MKYRKQYGGVFQQLRLICPAVFPIGTKGDAARGAELLTVFRHTEFPLLQIACVAQKLTHIHCVFLQSLLCGTLALLFLGHGIADGPRAVKDIVGIYAAGQALKSAGDVFAGAEGDLILFIEQPACHVRKHAHLEARRRRQQDALHGGQRRGTVDDKIVVLFGIPILPHKLYKLLQRKGAVRKNILYSGHVQPSYIIFSGCIKPSALLIC